MVQGCSQNNQQNTKQMKDFLSEVIPLSNLVWG